MRFTFLVECDTCACEDFRSAVAGPLWPWIAGALPAGSGFTGYADGEWKNLDGPNVQAGESGGGYGP